MNYPFKLALLLCLAVGLINCVQLTGSKRLIYTREDLMSMVYRGPVEDKQLQAAIDDIRRGPHSHGSVKNKSKKRRSRWGVRQRVKRRGNKPPLPVITLTNVRSINNKLDELAAKMEFDCDFRTSNLLCLTETWLKNQPNPTFKRIYYH